MQGETHSLEGKWQKFYQAWLTFRDAYRLLNRQDELRRLAAWASRKGYARTEVLYDRYSIDNGFIIARLRRARPRAVRWAYWLQWLSQLVRANPAYPRRGSGSLRRFRVA